MILRPIGRTTETALRAGRFFRRHEDAHGIRGLAGRELIDHFAAIPTDERASRLRELATESFSACAVAWENARAALSSSCSPIEARTAYRFLEPPYSPSVRNLQSAPDGAAFAMDVRAELTQFKASDPEFKALDRDLLDLLETLLDRASLQLRLVNWDAPASLLERLASLEAVHAVHGWDDLKNRVDADRRLYALFHPSMPDRPLAFTQIAITHGLADDVGVLLDPTAPTLDPGLGDTATFYSISSAHKGLNGLNFGATLIDQAVDALRAEFPRLKTFATLSPIPGLMRWVESGAAGDPAQIGRAVDAARAGSEDRQLRQTFLQLVARYLLDAKRDDGCALDPVENFHVGNGARIERINWRADLSPAGLSASAGAMVNYVYQLDKLERNRALYRSEGTITASSAVLRLVRRASEHAG